MISAYSSLLKTFWKSFDKYFLLAHVAYSTTSIIVLLAFLHNSQAYSGGLTADINLIVLSGDAQTWY